MKQIRKRERRQAEDAGWNTAILASVYLMSKGSKNVDPTTFNPHVTTDRAAKKGKSAPKGRRLAWMSAESAEGLMRAQELDLIPMGYWISLAAMWQDIEETARFHKR